MTDVIELEPAEAETFSLASSPCHLIHRAQQFAADCFTKEVGPDELTQRQFAVLYAVAANEGLTQTALVRATGIDRSTLAELVARMAGRKLLVRAKAQSDQRANTVTLTDEGRAQLDAALPRVMRADAAILAALPKAKRLAFIETLRRIAHTLEDDPQPDPHVIQPMHEAEVKTKKAKKKQKNKTATLSAKSMSGKKPKKQAVKDGKDGKKAKKKK